MSDSLEGFKRCEKCKAPFERLYLGGVGDWRTAIMCMDCGHVRRGLDRDRVIIPLVAEQYDMTVEEAFKRDEAAQGEYLKQLAKASDY